MKTISRWSLLSATTLAAISFAPPALAWEYDRCRDRNVIWESEAANLQVRDLDFPINSDWRASLEASVAAWNEAPATLFRYVMVYNDHADNDLGDGRNSVVMVNTVGGDAVMVTRRRSSLCLWPFWRKRITEVDIVVERQFNWNHDLRPSPAVADRSSILSFIHELGHGLGLKHNNSTLATMNDRLPYGGPVGELNKVAPHADDVAGTIGGYGVNSGQIDLIASAYRRSFRSSGAIPALETISRDHPTTFQFTIGNRGTLRPVIHVQFYLSTDNTITTADRRIGSTALTLDPGVTRTLNTTLTVPPSVPLGTYWFGYIVDPPGLVTETDEDNNAVALTQSSRLVGTIPPVACFTATPTMGDPRLTVTFNASCSTDRDGSIVEYRWETGDGNIRRGRSASHIYVDDGMFQLRLTVTDNDGRSDTLSRTISVFCTGDPGPNGGPCFGG